MRTPTIAKYLSLIALLATVAWVFWNPEGWNFDWGPLVAFLTALIAYITFDRRDHQVLDLAKSTPGHCTNPSDVRLFQDLLALLPSNGPIRFLKDHDFLGSFARERIDPIFQFYEEWDTAEHQFIDVELETKRMGLYRAAKAFTLAVTQYTSPNSAGLQAVRHDTAPFTKETDTRNRREAREINKAADQVVTAHQELVRFARETLRTPVSVAINNGVETDSNRT